VIEGMAREAIQTHTANRILTRCAWIARSGANVERFREVALLSTICRLLGTSRITGASLHLTSTGHPEDETIVGIGFASEINGSESELQWSPSAASWSEELLWLKKCFNQLIREYGLGRWRTKDVYIPQLIRVGPYSSSCAFAPNIEPIIVLDCSIAMRNENSTSLWQERYIELHSYSQPAERLRRVGTKANTCPHIGRSHSPLDAACVVRMSSSRS